MSERVGANGLLCAAGRGFLISALLCGAMGLAGCGSSGGGSGGSGGGGGGGLTGGTPLVAGGAKDVYVMQLDPTSGTTQSVLDFSADVSGSVTPKGTLLPPAGTQIFSLATDSAGQVYLGGVSTGSDGSTLAQVFVYAAGATGQATPLRTIHLIDTVVDTDYFYLPFEMAVGSSGLLYVVGGGVIGTFPANANGDTAATTTITFPGFVDGDETEYEPTGIAVDGSGNIYLGNYLQAPNDGAYILVYAAGANGNATPKATIYTLGIPYGLAVDASGNIYTSLDVVTLNSVGQVTSSTNQIVEYGSLTGSQGIIKTIAGATTGVTFGEGPQLDEAGNLYLISIVTNGTGTNATYTNNVIGFAPTATGDVEPGVVFNSSSWNAAGDQLALH